MDADDISRDVRAAARRRLRGLDEAEDDPARRARAAYYADHRARALRASKRWKQLNPDRAREHNRESMRRAYQARRRVQARRAQGRAWYAEHRDSERERHRKFRAEHPGKIHEYQQRYRERHPGRLADQARRASMKWRDRNADTLRAVQREAAAQRRRDDPDLHRRYYQSNLEKERLRSRMDARQRRRRERLGLPPRRIHQVFAEEKRANSAVADQFFTRRRTAPEIRDLLLERDAAPYARLARAEARRAARGLPASPDAADLRATVAAEVEQRVWAKLLPGMIHRYIERNRARISEEIRMDSIARQRLGKPPYDPTAELAQRMSTALWEHLSGELVPTREPERLHRLAKLLRPRDTPPHQSGRPRTDASAPMRAAGRGR